MNPSQSSDNFQKKIESWFYLHERSLYYGGLVLSLLIACLHFNARISEAHDDALYLEIGRAHV